MQIEHLKAERFRFSVKMNEPVRLPFYAGSMLRGAFGHALRKVACMTKQKECKSCPLYTTCPYPQIFESPVPGQYGKQQFSQIPNPYVIEPESLGERVLEPGDILSFDMVLIGEAIKQLSLVIFSWQKAASFGFSKTHSKGELKEVTHLGISEIPIWNSEKGLKPYPSTELQPNDKAISQISLDIKTPLRIQSNGKICGAEQLNAKEFLTTLYRRIGLLSEFHHGIEMSESIQEELNNSALTMQTNLRWCDWERYSNRQQQSMKLGGLVGQVEIEGELGPYMGLLSYGEKVHLGKNTTFGLGRYQVNHVN